MNPHMGVYLLVFLLTPRWSHQRPMVDGNQKTQTMADDSLDRSSNKIGNKCLHPRRERQEPEEVVEKETDIQALSAGTAETMRKINPLTIANQVSQMFRKRNHKNAFAKRPVVNDVHNSLKNEDLSGDTICAVQPEREETGREYIQQVPPRIVHKPMPNDNSYSIIVMTRNPMNLPIKIIEEDCENKWKDDVEDKINEGSNRGQDVFIDGRAKEQSSSGSTLTNKEIRDLKECNATTNFPVFNEDLIYDPDPLQGILNENYWVQTDKSDHHGSFLENKEKDGMFDPNNMQVRSMKDYGNCNVINGKVSCGYSWKKKNSSDAAEE